MFCRRKGLLNMKKAITILLALTFCLTLFGCNDSTANLPKPNVTGDNTVLGSDFQKNMNQSKASHIYNTCESEDGYFFLYADGNVYYLDKKSGASTILCGKPECSHTDDNCNAWAYGNFLTYYNGKLYWSSYDRVQEKGGVVDYGERLHCMDLDGTNHKVVQKLDFVPGGDTNNYITKPIIHRGIVYFCYSGCLYAVALGDDIDNAVCLYGEKISDDGSHIIGSNELYYELWADGDMVYFMAKNVKQKNGTYKDTLYSYDPQSEKLTKEWEVPDKSAIGSWDTTGVSVSSWYISGGYIYYYLCGNDLWYSKLSSGENIKLADLDISSGSAIFSSDYIVIMDKKTYGVGLGGSAALTGGDTLYVYNYSGELVKKISLKQIYDDSVNVSDIFLLWIDDSKVFLLSDATVLVPNATSTKLVYCMYSADIETGKVTKAGWSNGN